MAGEPETTSTRPVTPPGPRERRKYERELRELQTRHKEVRTQLKKIDAQIELQEMRQRALEDFYFFCTRVMGFRELYEPLHRPLCDLIADDKVKRKLILLPRGHFKTTIISICYPLWRLCQDQSRRVALCSKAAGKAEENLEELCDRASREEFLAFFGETIGPPETWPINRKDKIKLKRKGSTTGPSVAAYSTESSEVGRHFDIMLLDDIVDQENVGTQAGRDKVWQWFGRQLSVLDPGCELIVIGTRWHWDDPYSRIQKNFIRYETDQDVGWWIEKRAAVENGKLIFPTRFTKQELEQIKLAQGDYIYSCFYMNEPAGEGTNPFNPRNLRRVDYEPVEGAWTYILVDPASTKEEYSSYTGVIIGDAVSDKEFVIRRAILEKMHPDTLVDMLFDLVEEYKPFKVIIEDESYQKSLYYWARREMLQRGVHFTIQLIKNPRNISQELRLLALQPFVNNGVISFASDMPGWEHLYEEIETYPKGPHKDLICAMYFITHLVFPARRKAQEKPQPPPIRSRLLTEMCQRRQLASRRLPLLKVGTHR